LHRTKTHFAARVNHVATALEKRGVKATYTLHERFLSNRRSRRRFDGEKPQLDAVQQRIVADLETEGFSLLLFSELFPDEAEWAALEKLGERFVSETEATLASDPDALRVRQGKEFVVRKHSYESELGLDDPWFRASASHRMLDVANTYLGLWSKLEYVDVWYSRPQPESAGRVSSQRWHRDFNDRRLVKTFLYLVDVDEGAGPFQYVPGSAPGGRRGDLWPWRPLGENYPPEDELERQIAEDGARVFTGPKGTLLFCNTAGFHRGGFATEKPRVLATATYSSPASLASLTERSYRFSGSLDELDAPTRFALT
jgi:Phytanoyl-CoA dioxygenase (PhyH)